LILLFRGPEIFSVFFLAEINGALSHTLMGKYKAELCWGLNCENADQTQQ